MIKTKIDIAKLEEKKLILNVAFRYEKPINKLEIMQCRNCKRFEHAKSSCFNEFRCIKCPSRHEPGKCELPDASKPYCCNCEKDGHPANSPNCPIYIWLLSRRKNRISAPPKQEKKIVIETQTANKENDAETIVAAASETEAKQKQNSIPTQSSTGTIRKLPYASVKTTQKSHNENANAKHRNRANRPEEHQDETDEGNERFNDSFQNLNDKFNLLKELMQNAHKNGAFPSTINFPNFNQ